MRLTEGGAHINEDMAQPQKHCYHLFVNRETARYLTEGTRVMRSWSLRHPPTGKTVAIILQAEELRKGLLIN